MRSIAITLLLISSTCLAQDPTFVIGSRNPYLVDGAQALLRGNDEEGVEHDHLEEEEVRIARESVQPRQQEQP